MFDKGLAPELFKGTLSRVIKFGGFPIAHAMLTGGTAPEHGTASSRALVPLAQSPSSAREEEATSACFSRRGRRARGHRPRRSRRRGRSRRSRRWRCARLRSRKSLSLSLSQLVFEKEHGRRASSKRERVLHVAKHEGRVFCCVSFPQHHAAGSGQTGASARRVGQRPVFRIPLGFECGVRRVSR